MSEHHFLVAHNWMLKKSLSVMVFLVTCSSATAQRIYCLEECVDSALKNNLNIRSANYDLAKAQEQKREAMSSFLPQVTGTGSYQYYTKVPAQLIPSSLFGGGANSPKYVSGSFTLPQTTQAGLKLEHTIYNGQLLIALKAARANIGIYAVQVKSTQEDIAYNVGATYYNIQSLQRKAALYRDNLVNSEKLILATKLKLDNGIATKTDYNRILVSREGIKSSLATTQGQLDEQWIQLKFLMGKPLQEFMEIRTDSGKSTLPEVISSQANDPEKRSDVQLLEAQKKYNEIEKRNISVGYQPTLSMSQNFNSTGYNDRFSPFQTIGNSWFKGNSFSLNLSIPIYDGGKKRSQLRQKNIELQQYDDKIALNRRQAEKEVLTAVINYNSNVTTLRSQQENVELAGKIYVDRQLQFQNGIVGINDVLDAKNDLLDAENTFITALVNTRTASLDLKRAKGELLDKNK